jgi:signal transduction histidine kinase
MALVKGDHVSQAISDPHIDVTFAGDASTDPLLTLASMAESSAGLSEMAELQRFANAGRLVASVAHEIRNALAAAHAGLSYLSHALSAHESGDLAVAADEARESIDRALAASRNVLDVVRGRSGTLASISASKAVQRALHTVASKLAGGVRLELDLEPVPLVEAEEGGLHQALINVLLNAIDASPEGNGRLRVSVRQVGQRVHICVADNGPGIAPEIRDRLFQPMVTSKLPRGGTGLGLSISRAIIRSLGGEMYAENGPIGGAEFTIALRLGTSGDAVPALR